MANNDNPHEGSHIDEQLRALASSGEVQPNVARAWARLRDRERAAARRTRRRWAAVTTAAICLVLLALPWPRATAQRLWDRLVLGRVAVVQTSRGDLPESVTAVFTLGDRRSGTESTVETVGEAERLAGFRPSLPPPGVLNGTPMLSVVEGVAFSTRPLKTADIKRALAAAGVLDVQVPAEWEGTTLTAEGGPLIMAAYHDGVEVMQAVAFRMNMPAGFPFGRFMELGFRVFGRNASDARALGEKLAANPALVLHFPEHEKVIDIALRSGPGIIVGDPDGSDGICLFWNTSDRIFIVSADKMSQGQAVALANSIR